MKKIICFVAILFCLCVSASAADVPKFNTFKNELGDVAILYPDGWHVKESKYNNPYQVFISREPLTDDPASRFEVGITFAKFYNQGWYLAFKDNDRQGYYDAVLKAIKEIDSPMKLIKEERIQIAGVEGLLMEHTATVENRVVHMFYLYVLKNDVGVVVCLEAPDSEFEKFRDLYRNIIQNSSFYFTDGKKSDNSVFMDEVSNLIAYEMQRQMKEGMDDKKMMAIFDQAMAMSPANGTVYSLLGGYMFQMANTADEDTRKQLAPQVIDLLTLSEEYFAKHPESYNEEQRKFYQSQNNFLIGDAHQYLLKQPAEAKAFYEKSVGFFEHPAARKALEKYGNK